MKNSRFNPFVAALAATTFAALLATQSIYAGNIWDGGGAADNWTYPGNWDGNVAPNYSNALTFTGNVRNTPLNDRTAASTVASFLFTNDGSAGKTNAFTLTGNSITLTGNITTTANTAGATITDIIDLDMSISGTRVITTNQLSGSVQHNLTLSGDISGTGGINKAGNGQLNLTGSNSFDGLLSINGGTVNANSISALGTNATIKIGNVGASTVLNLTAGATSTNRQIQIGEGTGGTHSGGARINNNTTSGAGALVFTNDNFNALNGTATTGRTLTLGGANTDANEIQGIIANNSASGTIGVTKVDAGTWILSGSNSYTGATQVNGGILVFGKTAAKAAATTVTAAAAGSVGLGVGGAGFYSATNVGALFNTNTLTGFSLNSASGVAIDTTAGDFDQNVALTAARSLTKLGSNTLTLSQTNSYSGATNVTKGTLIVNGNISTSSLTTVASGATISGSGTVGALTINTGGFHNPGNSPGIMNTGNYTLDGTLGIEITGNTAGVGGYDQVNVNGTVDIAGGTLSAVFGGGTYANGNLLFILLNDSNDAITGTFTGFAQDAIVGTYGGFDWKISYTADSTGNTFVGGNDIALMAVPEPRAALLGGLGLLALLRRRR